MMRVCRNIKLDFSSRKRILFIVFWLSVDITMLGFFSGWLPTTHGRIHKFHLAGIIITSCFVSVLLILLRKAYILKVKEDVELAVNSAAEIDMEADAEFFKSLSGLPTRFSFKDLESATNAFSTKLGRGGFGSVYAGTLSDGTKVAVKRLEREGRGQKEFCAEVATISRIRHVNLVCLKGFCSEGSERLLAYEYMPRGSLDRWIFHNSEEGGVSTLSPELPSPSIVVLNWSTRHHIALGTARGLAYLHEECEEAILHLDVKPQNILLDENFRAKVSDFGLSRSMDKAQSRLITTMRGTPGYLAPEWLTDGGIDVKTDVYGFGMVVLELVSGRRSVDQSLDDLEQWFLPAMAFKKVNQNNGIDIIDPLLQGTLDDESCGQALRTIKVALWCIQENGAKRPSMSNVVQMLEGKMEVMVPPVSRNFLASRQHAGNAPFTTVTIIDAETLTLPR